MWCEKRCFTQGLCCQCRFRELFSSKSKLEIEGLTEVWSTVSIFSKSTIVAPDNIFISTTFHWDCLKSVKHESRCVDKAYTAEWKAT